MHKRLAVAAAVEHLAQGLMLHLGCIDQIRCFAIEAQQIGDHLPVTEP